MNCSELLKKSFEIQGIDLDLKEIPFNIFLKNTGDVLCLCFLEHETNDSLIVAETNQCGMEEIRIVPKDNIEYIGIFYDFEDIKTENDDKMII